MPSWREVFLYFLFLGFVNIGGPVAQITMMFNHMVEKRQWLSKDRFIKIMAFCHMLPGPEALQLAIYIGYLKRKLWGGVLAGVTFIVPGAIAMIVLSWLYVRYGKLPEVTNALYVLKPAVLGIIAAGIIKLGRASIRNVFLAILLVGAFVGMRFGGMNFLLILLIAGLLNLIVEHGSAVLKKSAPTLPLMIVGTGALIPFSDSRLFQIAWLFFKTGLTELRRRVRFACFRAARRGCAISLVVRRAAARWRRPQCSNAGTVHVVHDFCGLHRRRNSWRGARNLFCVFAVVCIRARRRALHRKSPRKPRASSIPRWCQRRSGRRNCSCIAGSDPRSVD